ncbi:MAG: hypothetical protein IKR92_01875, partial [Alphaproteobacteria bacterium]|nr:hypothetical protein [Alphaproteobacteria bacterium]
TELELLHDRKLVADDDFTTARDTLLKAIRERDLSAGLPEGQIPVQTVSPEDMAKARQLVDAGRDKIPQNKVASYKFELADRIVVKALEQDRRSETLLTPELTAVAIEGYTQTAKNKSLSDAEKQALNTKLRMTTSHGESLLYQLVDKRGYYFTDITNAADEYDGYMHLADVCEKKYEERMAAQNGGKKPNIKGYTSYDETRDLMKEYIKPYDELYHIPASKNATTELTKNPKNTAIKLTSRMVDATKIIDKLEFNEDTLGKEFLTAMQNFRFVEAYDKDGKPSKYEESIVLNADGKMEVVKGSRLDTALRFAANEGMIQDLGDFDKKITKESILEGAKDNTFKTLFAYANSEEVVRKGLRENPYKFTDPKYLEEFTRGLMNGEKTVDISLLANDLALKRQTNNMEVYGNRISGKVGAENAQYLKALLARQVQKIDGSSKDTKDNAAYLKNKATWRNLGTAALSGGISTAVAYAATKLSLGSSIGNALGLKGASTMVAGGLGRELIAGSGAAAIGVIGGAAVATLSFFAVKKIAAMTKHQKYGWKDVKKDLKSPTYLTALTAGALGGASVGFALSGCPLCAAGFGVASVGVAGSGRFIRSYKDMRLNGHGVAMATALGAVNAVATFAGAKLGYELGTSGVNMNETVTASAEQAKELYGEHGSNLEQSQSDGWNFESSDHQQPGYTLLEQETSEVGPYHNYNMQEHDWASMRNDGIRWSEYLNDGKGGLHVQPDYQNGTGGLNHDYALYDNAIKSLDEAAQQPGNEWMNTYENDEVKSNSAMLFYKLYQKAVLMHNDNVQLADGSGTVGDVYNVDADHTANGVFQKLLQGEKLDAQDVQVISNVEDNIGGEIHEGVNDMGKVPDIKGSTHPTDRVDSYTFGDKGYDEVTKNETADLYGKFTRVMDRVAGFGALLFALPRKVKDHLRPGAKADQRKIDETRRPIEPPVVIDNPPVVIDNPPVVIDNPPVIHPKPEEHQLLIEEYWMIHGYNPAAREMKDKNGKPLKDENGHIQKMEINPMAFDAGYKAYVQNVEKERVAKGGKPLLEFLQERRAEMDKVIKDQTASYLGGHNARLNADILDPVGYKQVLKKQAELKAEGKSMSKDEVDKAILWPTPKELTDNFTEHRPTSKLCKIIRDSFWRKDNKVDIKNPKQRSTVEMDAKDAKSNIEIIGPNKKVFSFYDFIASAKDTLVRTTKETERDVTKAPRRRTLDEMGKMRRTKQSQH